MSYASRLSNVSLLLRIAFIVLALSLSTAFEPKIGPVGMTLVWGFVLISLALFSNKLSSILLSSLLLGLLFLALHHPFETYLFIPNPHDLTEELSLLYLASTALAILIQALRLKSETLGEKELQTRSLYDLARNLAMTNSMEEIVTLLLEALKQQGFSRVALFLQLHDSETPILHSLSPYQPHQDEAEEANLFWNRSPTSSRFEKNSYGHYMCSLHGLRDKLGYLILGNPAPRDFPPEKWLFIETVIDQCAIGFEREILREKSQGIALMGKTQTLYKTLLNSVSHELKTPLATITGSASALLDPLIQDRPQLRWTLSEGILQASQRLTEVLDKLLDMSRIDSGTLKPSLDLIDVRDIIAMTSQRIALESPSHKITVSCASPAPCVKVDPVLMGQALYYILQNALRYGPSTGPIDIDITERQQDIQVSVRDHGPGIPSELQEKIFDKFYRGKPEKTGGLGLGLSIAHGFMELHGGTIAVKNHPEGGAIFTLSIPKGGTN